MSQQTRASHTPYTVVSARKLRASIPWWNSPWICAARGIILPTKCGVSLIPNYSLGQPPLPGGAPHSTAPLLPLSPL